MNFSPCTLEELETYEPFLTLSTWSMSKSFLYFRQEDQEMIRLDKIKVENEVVALIEYSLGMASKKSISIDNFEVFHKRNGIGSKIVTFLKNTNSNCIFELYPTTEIARSFWEKQGFKEEDDGTGTAILRLYN
ncbi:MULTISPECIES: GNAT family protein [Exiguobacterium]|uniref:GNAT family N-acetyltransferase n=1 Tax=Exiguobacterium TaxID=33986 RepID=UPI000479B871|nr:MULTISPECIES: GNAT family N-acetyltransferase [Exiguobacterium]